MEAPRGNCSRKMTFSLVSSTLRILLGTQHFINLTSFVCFSPGCRQDEFMECWYIEIYTTVQPCILYGGNTRLFRAVIRGDGFKS